MSSKTFTGEIPFEWIQCQFDPLSKQILLTGRLGQVRLFLGSYYVNNNHKSIQVKNLPNYFKTRLIQMDQGLTIGFTKELYLTGVFHKVSQEGKIIQLDLGYSHPIHYTLPDHVHFVTRKEGSERLLMFFSLDKELVSQVAAQIYHLKKPEPYKGTGFRYKHQILSKKVGKKK